jgi:hypothetical protein
MQLDKTAKLDWYPPTKKTARGAHHVLGTEVNNSRAILSISGR